MALAASDGKLARRLGAEGRKRAMQFDWAGAAQRMDWLVQEAAKAG
jgi:hypothetical protein